MQQLTQAQQMSTRAGFAPFIWIFSILGALGALKIFG